MKVSKDIRNLLDNTISFSVIQALRYIIPMATIPYLIRVLGADIFGAIAFAQAIMIYFSLLSDYGFNFTGPRDISINRDNLKKVSEVFSSIMVIKVALTIVGLCILLVCLATIPRLQEENTLLVLSCYGVVVSRALSVGWLFQGFEKIRYYAIIAAVFQFGYAVAVFILVKNADDFLLVPIINSASLIIAEALSLIVAIKVFNLQIVVPSISRIRIQIKEGFHFFLSQLSLSSYTVMNSVLLGFFTTNRVIGYYSAAEKCIRALEGLLQPVVNSLYPYMVRTQNLSLLNKIICVTSLAGILSTVSVYFYSNLLVEILFGKGFEYSADLLRVFVLEWIIVFPSAIIGTPYLVAFGYPEYFSKSNMLGTGAYFVGVIVIYSHIDPMNIIIITLISHGIVLVWRLFGVFQHLSPLKFRRISR